MIDTKERRPQRTAAQATAVDSPTLIVGRQRLSDLITRPALDIQRHALDAVAVSQTLAEHVAGQLRAEMARREINAPALAKTLGVSEMWVSRRMRGKTQVTMADLERIAVALDVPLTIFVPAEVAS